MRKPAKRMQLSGVVLKPRRLLSAKAGLAAGMLGVGCGGPPVFHGSILCAAVPEAESDLNFGAVDAGQGETLALRVTNIGACNDLTIQSAAFSGANSQDFTLQTALPVQAAVGATGTLEIAFAPTAAGQESATLLLTTDGFPQTVSVQLTGSQGPVDGG